MQQIPPFIKETIASKPGKGKGQVQNKMKGKTMRKSRNKRTGGKAKRSRGNKRRKVNVKKTLKKTQVDVLDRKSAP